MCFLAPWSYFLPVVRPEGFANFHLASSVVNNSDGNNFFPLEFYYKHSENNSKNKNKNTNQVTEHFQKDFLSQFHLSQHLSLQHLKNTKTSM